MTLTKLLIYVAIAAVILTLLVEFVFKKRKNLLVSYLQNFCGALFIFSGWVKAVDPLGTAYKMEQYFGEFESTFAETWMSFLAPLFPFLSGYAVAFSVFMVIFEIVLGIMLIMGTARKFTSWAFFLLVAFFTFLTGFTYLTGYVPDGVNFFEVGKWGEYVKSNMKVTDCGCFGDFIKLEPYTSFLKDVFLMVPALIFLWRYKDMHQIAGNAAGTAIAGISTVGLLFYCLSNFSWNIPSMDFRPFRVGVDIAATKKAEETAASNVQITHYRLKNKASNEIIELPYNTYLKEYKNYPKTDWEVVEQVKTEPALAATKISEYAIENLQNEEITEELLNHKGYSVMIVSYQLKHTVSKEKVLLRDSVFVTDTLVVGDSTQLVRRFDRLEKREVVKEKYNWDKDFQQPYIEKVNPFAEAAEKAGLKVYAVTKVADPGFVDDFRHATQTAYDFYMADDILLKTIVRSNPGVLLMKDAKILQKWHHKKLPSFEEAKAKYIK